MTTPAPPGYASRHHAAVAQRGRLCAGIDPHAELLEQWGLPVSAAGLAEFADICVEALAPVAAVIKPQIAFFEGFGADGFKDERRIPNVPGVYPLEVGPNPAMPEITEPVVVSAYDIFLTTSAALSDEEATAILTALYDAFPQLREDYPPLRGGAQDAMGNASNTVPYHPAAIAFFQEKGLWSDANEAREASFTQ